VTKFEELVWRMRLHQKRYWATKDRGDLIEAKTLEAQVDRHLKAVDQMSLFNQDQEVRS